MCSWQLRRLEVTRKVRRGTVRQGNATSTRARDWCHRGGGAVIRGPKSKQQARTRDAGASVERADLHAVGMNGAPSATYSYQPCRWCRHYGGARHVPQTARCADPRAPHVHTGTEYGCSFWEREPGTVDDTGDCPMPYGATLGRRLDRWRHRRHAKAGNRNLEARHRLG